MGDTKFKHVDPTYYLLFLIFSFYQFCHPKFIALNRVALVARPWTGPCILEALPVPRSTQRRAGKARAAERKEERRQWELRIRIRSTLSGTFEYNHARARISFRLVRERLFRFRPRQGSPRLSPSARSLDPANLQASLCAWSALHPRWGERQRRTEEIGSVRSVIKSFH